jgi:hypothetical protein
MNMFNQYKQLDWSIFYSFIYLHSLDPYMAGIPVDIEIVNDNKTSHINYINTN